MADSHNRGIEDQICKTLTWMRHRAELESADLAERLGVSRVTIWNWENGVKFPLSLFTLRGWAEAVGAKLEIKLTVKMMSKDDAEFTF